MKIFTPVMEERHGINKLHTQTSRDDSSAFVAFYLTTLC